MIEPPTGSSSRIPPLPIRPRPQTDDTIDSYIHRLEQANHLKTGQLREYVLNRPKYGSRPSLERLAAASGRTPTALQHALGLRCAECGKPLDTPAEQGRPARWCSKRCRQAAYRRRHPSQPKESTCEWCGRTVAKYQTVRWCSPNCQKRHRSQSQRSQRSQRSRDKPVFEYECEYCGIIRTGDRSLRWCSAICRESAWKRAEGCPICGAPLTRGGPGRPAFWCSERCRKAAYRERHSTHNASPTGKGQILSKSEPVATHSARRTE